MSITPGLVFWIECIKIVENRLVFKNFKFGIKLANYKNIKVKT